MREIKFRAWDKKDKCWAKWGNIEMGCRNYPNDYVTFEPIPSWPTDDYEIMQFTGLLDVKGKEIYEGDIINLTELGEKVIVAWNPVYASFGIELNGCKYAYWLGEAARPDNDKIVCEVIGNIYENPELLK